MRTALYFFGILTDDDIYWMATTGQRRLRQAGDYLIVERQPVSTVFLVLSGEVSVEVEGRGEVARRRQGDLLGEMSFVDQSPPSASVRVMQPTLVLELEKALISARLDASAAFAARFYKALAILLSDRLRGIQAGGNSGVISDPIARGDELDETVLDTLSMAGTRFNHMIRVLSGERES